jgi:hypothetical protein
MPVLQNSIGDEGDEFFFEDLQGTLIAPHKWNLELWNRPGRFGTIARKLFQTAPPVQVRSVHYIEDWLTAHQAIEAYQALIGEDPVDVWQHDVYVGKFVVIDVFQLPETRACYNAIGTIVDNPEVIQYCQWTLLYSGNFLTPPTP